MSASLTWQILIDMNDNHKNKLAEKIRVIASVFTESQYIEVKQTLNIAADRLQQLEKVCDGLSQDAIDGGFNFKDLSLYAKSLEEKIKAIQFQTGIDL